MNNPPSDPEWNPKICPMADYIESQSKEVYEPAEGGGADRRFWTKGAHSPLSIKVEALAFVFNAWVAGFHVPVGDEVHIWQEKYLAWRDSDIPKPRSWLGRWAGHPDRADPRRATLARLHRDMVGFLLVSSHHEPPVWEAPADHLTAIWRLEATLVRASEVIKALLVELVGEGKISISPETVVTHVEEPKDVFKGDINHDVWMLIADKLWDPGWDWSQLRVRQA